MNQRKLTEVALITFGVYALIRGISYSIRAFPNVSIDMFFSWTLLPYLIFPFFPSLIYWVAAGILFWYAHTISGKLFGADEEEESTEALQIHDWYRLAFSITGIVLLFWLVLPGLMYGTSAFLFPLDLKDLGKDQFGIFDSLSNIFERQVFGFLGNLVEGGIGIYLIMRAKQLAGFIVRMQNRQSNAS